MLLVFIETKGHVFHRLSTTAEAANYRVVSAFLFVHDRQLTI